MYRIYKPTNKTHKEQYGPKALLISEHHANLKTPDLMQL